MSMVNDSVMWEKAQELIKEPVFLFRLQLDLF